MSDGTPVTNSNREQARRWAASACRRRSSLASQFLKSAIAHELIDSRKPALDAIRKGLVRRALVPALPCRSRVAPVLDERRQRRAAQAQAGRARRCVVCLLLVVADIWRRSAAGGRRVSERRSGDAAHPLRARRGARGCAARQVSASAARRRAARASRSIALCVSLADGRCYSACCWRRRRCPCSTTAATRFGLCFDVALVVVRRWAR